MNAGVRLGDVDALRALREEVKSRQKAHVSFPPSTVEALLDFIGGA